MTPERFAQIHTLADSALELEAAERREYVERACAGDEDLRHEVERLLAAHESADGFLEAPALEAMAREMAREVRVMAGRTIDRY